ncbi:hypothetical protein LOY54_15925 [Pseudomonas sp. B21-032]|uniref:hypothetical protein n=1 Tax=Pseudomonas sp. B21-032 TaxID=2895483 RepID=UPI00215F8FC9|nr:hypothetical protein [Pseudomonas sp. B21-032]UVL59537.1 hypothetical protein LOY54_15925 [Pseudomonas sp. B21-032]
MDQLKTRIAELKQALQQLVEHNVHNPETMTTGAACCSSAPRTNVPVPWSSRLKSSPASCSSNILDNLLRDYCAKHYVYDERGNLG